VNAAGEGSSIGPLKFNILCSIYIKKLSNLYMHPRKRKKEKPCTKAKLIFKENLTGTIRDEN